MKFELNVKELGNVLKKIDEKENMKILIKSALNGGWLTVTGDAEIVKIPDINATGCAAAKDVVIDIKVKNNENSMIFKITGNMAKKFNVDFSEGRYKNLNNSGININQIKTNHNETKIRVDENIIFTVKKPVQEVLKIVEN